jgi:hypothetical protein
MPVHWIIQENQRDSDEVRIIVQTLESEGHIPHLVQLSKSLEIPAISDLPDGEPLICHGPGFVTRALNHPRFGPGLFFEPSEFCWSAFHAGWEGKMLSLDGHVMPLSAAASFLDTGVSAFIRPDSDSKVFDGCVYDKLSFARVAAKFSNNGAISVVVASPVEIEAEWRFFIVESEVVGCSEYRRWGRFSTHGSVPRAAIELAGELASLWSPAAVYCLDLAATSDRIGVVEANCFNASRMYAAAIPRVVGAVNAFLLARA